MTSAIFGLIGVIVGALITGAVETWRDWRRRKAKLRQALRLVAEDVRLIHADFQLMWDLRQWPTTVDHFMPTDAWDAHRSTLAREIGEDQWSVLASLLSIIPFVRGVAATKLGEALSETDVELIRDGPEHYADLCEELTGDRPISLPGSSELERDGQ